MNLPALNELDLGEMADWPQSAQWLFMMVLCMGLLVVAYFGLIQSQQRQLQQLIEQEGVLRETFESQQSQAANLARRRAQLRREETTFAAMLKQLPERVDVSDLLIDVSQTGLAAGLEFVFFQPLDAVTGVFYVELPLRFRVLGDYHQLGQFISALAALPRIITLHDMTIQPQFVDRTAHNLLVMEATVKTYRYQPDENNG
jgi:type IV pilus assembly protein PilO